MVYGNFDALRALVYPNDAVPAGSELLLDHTTVTEHTYDGFVKLDFAGSIAALPLTGDVGVRVSRMQSASTAITPMSIRTFTS